MHGKPNVVNIRTARSKNGIQEEDCWGMAKTP